MAKQQENYDPSKPLRNRKHEKFCQELAKKPEASQDSVYKEVYPASSEASALSSASDLLSKPNIRDRVLSLMSRYAKRDIVGKVSERLDQHVDSANESTSMDAIKTTLKIAGALDDQKQAQASYNPTAIVINIVHPKTQPIDAIDVTAQEDKA